MPFNQPLRKNSHVLWTVSLIQDIQPDAQTKTEFNQMAADVMGAESIEKITLCTASELQRFRLMIFDGIPESDALKKCEVLSNHWDQENTEMLTKLSEGKKLTRLSWKEFLTWEHYQETIDKVQKYYEKQREFRHDVDGRIRQELKNVSSTAKMTDPNQQTQLFKRYLFEECAFQQFAATKGFHYELYKTPVNKAMRYIKKDSEFVAPGYMTEIYFTQFKPNKKHQQTSHCSDASLSSMHTDSVLPTSITSEGTSFSSVFSPVANPSFSSLSLSNETASSSPKKLEVLCEKPPIVKTAEFIEKTLQLLSPELQNQAIAKLLKFTAEEIIPLSYVPQNVFKN